MYLFFDNVPSNPTAEILKLKLQSPSYPDAARCSPVQPELKPGLYLCASKEKFDRGGILNLDVAICTIIIQLIF